VLGKILAKIERSTGANNNLEKFKVTYRILPSGNYAAVTDSFRYDPSTGIFACRITLDSADVRNSTDVHLAQAILHENIHAYMMSLLMRRWGGTSLAALEMMTYDSIFTQHIDTLAVSDSAQLHALALSQDYDHNYMQSKLLSLIADAIRLFDRNAINNDRYYWYLAWGGLYGTKPWLTHWPNYNTPPPGNWPIVGAPYTTEDSTRGMRYALTPTRLDSIVRVQNAERFSSPTSKGRKPKPGGCYN
jgi:hypothetical protein